MRRRKPRGRPETVSRHVFLTASLILLIRPLVLPIPAHAVDDHLFLCEAVVTLTADEFIEIVNPTSSVVALDNYYLSDDQEYALVPSAHGGGPSPTVHSGDFFARFPNGATIQAGETLVIAFDATDFNTEYSFKPDFEITENDATVDNLVEAFTGSIHGSAGLTNSGEMLSLFYWDGSSDLVEDVDLVRIGSPSAANDLSNKALFGAVDGPDAGSGGTTYATDALDMPVPGKTPGSNKSAKRVLSEGSDEDDTGGNGLTGDDESTENIAFTWDTDWDLIAADPGVCCVTTDCYYTGVDASSQANLRASLHDSIDDHRRRDYSDVWTIGEIAQQDPLDGDKIIGTYGNRSFDAEDDRFNPPTQATGYSREHAWPKSCGFPDDLVSNYPFTDGHHLFLTDQDLNGARSNKPYDTCDPSIDATCAEEATDFHASNGQGGETAPYPGSSDWTPDNQAVGDWETWWYRRGDVARALLYMDVRYKTDTHLRTGDAEPDLELVEAITGSDCTGGGTGKMATLSTLLEWHLQDPVDFDERLKNETVYRYQTNRNPFVDHPEWVPCVFLNLCQGVSDQADLSIAKENGWNEVAPGDDLVYAIEVRNDGPDFAAAALVTDTLDAAKLNVADAVWSCAPASGSSLATGCPMRGAPADLAAGIPVSLASGETVRLVVNAAVKAGATGSTLDNTATVAAPPGVTDPGPDPNAATDSDTLLALGSCGAPTDRNLLGETLDATRVVEACEDIRIGQGTEILAPADVTLRAGERVVFENGFSLEGGALEVEIDPSLAT